MSIMSTSIATTTMMISDLNDMQLTGRAISIQPYCVIGSSGYLSRCAAAIITVDVLFDIDRTILTDELQDPSTAQLTSCATYTFLAKGTHTPGN